MNVVRTGCLLSFLRRSTTATPIARTRTHARAHIHACAHTHNPAVQTCIETGLGPASPAPAPSWHGLVWHCVGCCGMAWHAAQRSGSGSVRQVEPGRLAPLQRRRACEGVRGGARPAEARRRRRCVRACVRARVRALCRFVHQSLHRSIFPFWLWFPLSIRPSVCLFVSVCVCAFVRSR